MRSASTSLAALARPTDRAFTDWIAGLQRLLGPPPSAAAVPNPAEIPRPGPRVTSSSSSVCLFVLVTRDEATALRRLSSDRDVDASTALAKIRQALEDLA